MGDHHPTLFDLEEWRTAPGYHEYYEVSSLGRVRSVPRTVRGKNNTPRNLPSKVLTPHPTPAGYLGVVLSVDGTVHRWTVHRLVGEAFIGPLPDGMHTCHLNGNKTDNRATNLYYGTPSDNQKDSLRHGTNYARNKTHCPRGHLLQEPNLVKSQLERGWRECQACAWARPHASGHEFRALADTYFHQLMRGTEAA